MNIEMGMTDSYHRGGTLAEHTVEKGWAETFVFFWESVSGDKIRPQYVRREETKDTIGRYHCFTSGREGEHM